MCISDECTIAHLRAPHWEIAQDPRSVFGKVALLHAVSWLHVFGTFCGIHTGTYRIVWRLAVLPRAQCVFDIAFRAKAQNGLLAEAHLPRNAQLLEFGSDYFDFVLPDLLKVTDPFEDIDIECKCTSRDWKTNLMLCSVRLEPVDSISRSLERGWTHQLLKIDGGYRSGRRLRRLQNLRSEPGASYRPWQPWTSFRWYESASMVLFFVVLAITFAQLLWSRTT
ncbi:hypothetical protein H4R99_006829 [Coemansia sp. RSA 1722]|nr:hypothetical protein IWW45_007573 [Coemansia sp. RSA 485]KAJ2591234.1 hypothetical protein H4R99_006829 [Coemansia sp. RSA 1722]